jgi:hypothetical protein
LKPPIPTSNQDSRQEQTRQRRAALLPMAAGLLTILGFAVYTFWQDSQQNLPIPLVTGQMNYIQGWGEGDRGQGDESAFNLPRTANDLLTRSQVDRPLVGEPANVPAPQRGRRLGGFVRRDGDIAESVVFWELPGSAAAASEFYRKAADEAGFQSHAPATAGDAQGVYNAIYVRSPKPEEPGVDGPPADQVLVVRVVPRGNSQCLVTLIHRHRFTP